MNRNLSKESRILEVLLILVCLGLTCLLYTMQGYKMVILNLFFLPVALSGFFLGRYRAGVLALFCAVSASLVTALRLADLGATVSPLVIALAVAVWAAVLGLTALLVGTLSDDRAAKLQELHDAYVGVVEVLSQYLQSAHPRLKARSIRVAELSQEVAAAMKLSPRQIDDIRVAALLYDVGNIEVTTRVIRRAFGTFEDGATRSPQNTFQGMDLMLSLGSVLSGAVPLLLKQDQSDSGPQAADEAETPADIPVGAKIIRLVRKYWTLAEGSLVEPRLAAAEILKKLRHDRVGRHDAELLGALERAVLHPDRVSPVPLPGAPSPAPEIPAEMAAP
jgi:hypothetical protein